MYTCHYCFVTERNTTDEPLQSGLIKKYQLRYVCKPCSSQFEQILNQNNKNKNNRQYKPKQVPNKKNWYTSYHCPHCNLIFDNKRAINSWCSHITKHHKHDQSLLNITNMKLCDNYLCDQIIPNTIQFCINHIDQLHDMQYDQITNNPTIQTLSSSNNNNINNSPSNIALPSPNVAGHQILDNDGRIFDMNRCIKYFNITEQIKNKDLKHQIAVRLVKAINNIAAGYTDIHRGKLGAVQLAALYPSFSYQPLLNG